MSATFPFSELLIQVDRELHLARQATFAVGAGLPCPLGASANAEGTFAICVLCRISGSGKSEVLSAALLGRSVCPMCRQWQDVASHGEHAGFCPDSATY